PGTGAAEEGPSTAAEEAVVAEEMPAAPAGADASIADRSDLLHIVPIRRVLGTRMFIAAVLAGAGCFWTQGFLTTWSPKFLGSVVALPPEMIGLVSTFPWVLGALALLVLGYASRFLMRRGVTVRWALGALFGASLLCSGACFLILPSVGGPLAVVFVTLGAGLAMIYPLAPTAIAFCVCSKQRGAVMATLTGLASLGGVVAPAMVGGLMDRAGYVPAPKGAAETAEMAARLGEGMNSAFWVIGIYLVVVGVLSVLMLNPDRTGERLQQRFVYNG
ncbi:MAG TPA: MFS transporter, partial [Arthrobacter sp.]|nr:MFS transporter [Arthrobacter sp.]